MKVVSRLSVASQPFMYSDLAAWETGGAKRVLSP